jgi:hypothetical protein
MLKVDAKTVLSVFNISLAPGGKMSLKVIEQAAATVTEHEQKNGDYVISSAIGQQQPTASDSCRIFVLCN